MTDWTAFERSTLPPFDKRLAQTLARDLSVPYAAVKASHEELLRSETWLNNRYQVQIWRDVQPDGWPHLMIWLSVKRLDKAPIHDWRDLQRIKNELVGAEHEAIEMYPAESRLVDTANQYHLFAFADPAVRLPLGWQTRSVTKNATGDLDPATNTRQRPLGAA